MRELTYSQDVIFEDTSLFHGLAVACGKIWLPHTGMAQAMLESAEECEADGAEVPPWTERLREHLKSDDRLERISEWEERNQPFFEEGVIERLPPALVGEEQSMVEDLSFKDIWNDWKPGVTTELALHCHLTLRDIVPGIALFESEAIIPAAGEITGARVLSVNIPKLRNMSPSEVLEQRNAAQKKDISAFWDMIDHYNELIANDAAVDRIQSDIYGWKRDNLILRGQGLAASALATLCFVNPIFLPVAAIASANFISTANARWAERDAIRSRGFKFVSAVSRA